MSLVYGVKKENPTEIAKKLHIFFISKVNKLKEELPLPQEDLPTKLKQEERHPVEPLHLIEVKMDMSICKEGCLL